MNENDFEFSHADPLKILGGRHDVFHAECIARRRAIAPRLTRFGNMLRTLNQVYVIDDIFRAHLLAQSHDFQDRITATTPSGMC
ncbi:MAG: hypothetical protein WA071_04645 [Undibacterium umbellatum]|uniref:hypothetical protein n=1 Tax=Undibacterium umbellatum TaxID=2762300 RepID=UPI003BB5A654